MDDIKTFFGKQPLEEISLAAMQINTHLRLWNRDVILSREKDGIFTQEFYSVKGAEFIEQQLCLAAGLLESRLEKGDPVAVFSPNSVRYAITLFAVLAAGGIFVPIYPTTTEEEAETILRHSETGIIFSGDMSQYQKTLSILRKVKSPLRRMIAMHYQEKADSDVMSYERLIKLGRESGRLREAAEMIKKIKSEDLAALIYTPGSTGTPKGVLLTHGNFLAQKKVIQMFNITDKDVRLAHLPFSHVFGLSADLFGSIVTGSLLCITRSFETDEMLSYLRRVKPTVICSVPRMYEKICVNVLHGVNQLKGIRRNLLNLAILVGREDYVCKCRGRSVRFSTKMLKHILFPVLRGIRKTLNLQKARIIVSGGGPLPIEVANFFGGIGLPIVEGYGLTETAPIINVNPPEKNKPGTVGPPLEGVEERISDDGEILVKGPMVFRGYYKNPEDETPSFTEDGFFRTGDIGRFDEDGYLTITGRIKDLVITSSGKNIAPLNVERLFEDDPMISYICVVGDGRKYLTALIVPDFHMLRTHARETNISFTTDDDLVSRPEIIDLYKKRINAVCRNLASHEQIKKFTLLPNEFSVSSGELSPTFKFRRRHVHEKYRDIIDSMYPSGDSIKNGIGQ